MQSNECESSSVGRAGVPPVEDSNSSFGAYKHMIEIIRGNLLEAKEKFLVHQTNCFSNSRALGLAAAVFEKHPYANCYLDRKEQSIPGTIDVRGNGIDQRFVINLHGQVYPGKPKHPRSALDGTFARETYFRQGLDHIAQIPNLESVAFPFNIGCGLAGGNWENYLAILADFANLVEETQGIKVTVYQHE